MIELTAIFAALVASVAKVLGGYAATSTGARNDWTLDAAANVLRIMPWVDAIETRCAAKRTSTYRAPEVQRAVYRAKESKGGAPWAEVVARAAKAGETPEAHVERLATTSRHTRGLAADYAPRGQSLAELAASIATLAAARELGPVRLVLREADHVHVEWRALDEPAQPVRVA